MSPKLTIPSYIQSLLPTPELNFIDMYKKAIKSNKKIKSKQYSKILNEKIQLGNIAFENDDIQEFTVQTLSVIDLASQFYTFEPQIKGFCNLGLMYQNKRIYDVALTFAKEGYNLANRCNLLEMKIDALKTISLIHTNLGNRNEMMEVYEKMAEIYKALGQYDKQEAEIQKIAEMKKFAAIFEDSTMKNGRAERKKTPIRPPTDQSNQIVIKVDLREAKKAMELGAMGDKYSKLGNHQKALEHFQKILEFQPDDAAAWSAVGREYFHLGNPEKAIEAAKKAVEIDPKNIRTLTVLRDLYIDLGTKKTESYYTKNKYLEEALKVINICIGLKPNSEEFESIKDDLLKAMEIFKTQKANKDIYDAFLNPDGNTQTTKTNTISMDKKFQAFKEMLVLTLEGKNGINIREIVDQLVIVQPEKGDKIISHTSIGTLINLLLQNMEMVINKNTKAISADLSISTKPCFCCSLFTRCLNVLFSKTTNVNHLQIKAKWGDLTEPEEDSLRLTEFEDQLFGFFDSLGALDHFRVLYTMLAVNRLTFRNFTENEEVLKESLLHPITLTKFTKRGINLEDHYIYSN